MTRFICNNCGTKFVDDIQNSWEITYTQCPECESKYVEIIGPGLLTVKTVDYSDKICRFQEYLQKIKNPRIQGKSGVEKRFEEIFELNNTEQATEAQ